MRRGDRWTGVERGRGGFGDGDGGEGLLEIVVDCVVILALLVVGL
jgi:hypothetical protein